MTFCKQRCICINKSEVSLSRSINQNGLATAKQYPFSYIFIGEANKNIDSAKEVRATPEVADAPHLRLLAVRK